MGHRVHKNRLPQILQVIYLEKVSFQNHAGEKRQMRNLLERGKGRKGVRRYKKATTLHHKKHLKQFPQLALDRDNVILVCDECHKEEHPEIYAKTQKITEERWD